MACRTLILAVLVVIFQQVHAFSPRAVRKSDLALSSQKSELAEDKKRALLETFGAGVGEESLLLCPLSLTPLALGSRSYWFLDERYLTSREFGSVYKQDPRGVFWDLTIPSENDAKPWWQLSQRERVGSRLFQSPLLPFVYERGYRQNFENAGFPGPDKEYAEAESFFLEGEGDGGSKVVLDLSCGSGFMSRRFINSGKFRQVVSADLSPAMLLETARRCDEENVPRPTMIRADAARLPFASNSLDCVHAGAAMHCWPRLAESLSEIYRVLKPGGKFFTTTFFSSLPNVAFQRREGGGGTAASGFYLFESSQEIESFVRGGGFEDVTVRQEGRGCAIVKAAKALV